MRRLDRDEPAGLRSQCRLRPGETWEDSVRGHRVAVGDATVSVDVDRLCDGATADLNIHDPPYQIGDGEALSTQGNGEYTDFTRAWVINALAHTARDAHFYIWTGADQRNGFFPLPEVISTLRTIRRLTPRSYITVRNQRGYGTQKNWMAVRQELLYYVCGSPDFAVSYTDIPRKTRGYRRAAANGVVTTNEERSRSATIRPGNVWFDIQQVFYRMRENVPGAYAQKPIAAVDRVMETVPALNTVLDLFAHSGTTLIAAERRGVRCLTMDCNPLFAELTIRRLERYRRTGLTGWGRSDPFAAD